MECLRKTYKIIHKGRKKKNMEFIFYCENCKRVWELIKHCGQRGFEYYTYVPSYGKEHRICPDCEKNSEAYRDNMQVHYSSLTNEWKTPKELFDELNNEFHFTLDPCCSLENRKCKKYYTIKEDGLSKSWKDEIVFMNPPYGREIGKWVQKAYEESLQGALVVCLIPARTDTKYWHTYIFHKAEIRFLKGRVKFSNKGSAPFPSAIVIFKNIEK